MTTTAAWRTAYLLGKEFGQVWTNRFKRAPSASMAALIAKELPSELPLKGKVEIPDFKNYPRISWTIDKTGAVDVSVFVRNKGMIPLVSTHGIPMYAKEASQINDPAVLCLAVRIWRALYSNNLLQFPEGIPENLSYLSVLHANKDHARDAWWLAMHRVEVDSEGIPDGDYEALFEVADKNRVHDLFRAYKAAKAALP